MLRDYSPLDWHLMQGGAGYAQPSQAVPDRATLDDPALNVMTDLRSVTAVIILSGDPLDEANRRMIQRGVRLLFVVDQDRRVVGVITSHDIIGEKPMRVVAERGMRREELLVRDVMTPQESLQVLDLATVRVSKVGHVVATLKQSGRQHALVVERDSTGRESVRGIFSSTQIARQLGVAISATGVAHTFSEIEAQLAR